MKKIDWGAQFVAQHLSLFACPVCHQPYQHVENHTVSCANGHSLDFNRRGSLYFLPHAVTTEYDSAMLAARRKMLTAGLFQPLVKAINDQLPTGSQTILDVGTGEGTPLAQLDELRQQTDDTLIGFDLSKDGINLATQLTTKAFFCVADLAKLPFTNQQFDAVIELFSPSAYSEFERILKPGGRIVKIVPNRDYLVELRHALYEPAAPQFQYDNQRVVALFKEHYPLMTVTPIHYQFAIGPDKIADMMAMTPLSWGSDDLHRQTLLTRPVTAVTVDVSVLTVRV
ncbi:methyltransferase domain-containing protein [Furfurilactobacillus curtus]